MRTIFFKLFFWFWLAMTLSGIFFFLLAFHMRLGPLHAEFEQRFGAERIRIVSQALALYGRTAAAIQERYGKSANMDSADRVAPPGMRGYLFSADGTPLSGEAPPPIRDAVHQLIASGIDKTIINKGSVAVAVRVWGPLEKPYVAAAEAMPPPPQRLEPPPGFPFPRDFWFRFCISFVTGGLVCYGLAWHLTSPIRRLRAAAQSLATGDLTARVTIGGKGPGDEVADLGRDFNGMAERIEKLVTAQKQLVRDVSHELRSPLARLGVALGLARRVSPPAATAALDRIELESERLNEMIGELLTLSMLESGSDRFEKKPFDISGLVDEVVRDADFEAAGGNRKVQCVSCLPLILSGNREMLRRALENVVRNGVRYTGQGTAVEVSLEQDAPDCAVIRVRDHGPGVPDHALEEIFRSFYRVAEARDRQSGSTGIGLAITERTVKLHGGSVTARNVPGGGLEVEIRLPSVGLAVV
jgi:two-component system sensor histidine kinase CpxA